MQTQQLGNSPLIATRLAYGAMRAAAGANPATCSDTHRQTARRAFLAAFEAGYALFDHADIYGRTICETLFGDLLRDTPSLKRSDFLVATKCGIRRADEPPGAPQRYDFSKEHILWSCEQSLKRLHLETIDLYQLHRPDFLMDPHEVAAAFDLLKRQGKARTFGVSNFLPSQLSALHAALPFPLLVNQVEIHLARLDCLTDGTLDQCLEKQITPLAWSPLAGGALGTGGTIRPDHPRKTLLENLQKTLDEIAPRYNSTRTNLALAWLLKHPAKIIPIVGSANPENIREAVKAATIDLAREDWYRLLLAARGSPLP